MATQYTYGSKKSFLSNPGKGGTKKVSTPDPWYDTPATPPDNLADALRWAEYIWLSGGAFTKACQRIARYFITTIQVEGDLNEDDTKQIRDTYRDELDMIKTLCYLGDQFMCYGNVYAFIYRPFRRFLQCDCGFSIPLEEAFKRNLVRWENFMFKKQGECPSCKEHNRHMHSHRPWRVEDKFSNDLSKVSIRSIPGAPHSIELGYSTVSGKKYVHWNIDGKLKSDIENGVEAILLDTNMEIIEAVRDNDGKFTFHDDSVFHASNSVPAGVQSGGWGIPLIVTTFRNAHLYQTLNRLDHAIASDYITGPRVLSPPKASQVGEGMDPAANMGGANFSGMLHEIIKKHKRDPGSWHVSPSPLEYQLLGAEGTALTPKDLKVAALDEWLDACGFPADLWHGNMTIQAAPISLRLFENMWPEIPAMYNDILAWLSGYLTAVFDQPEHTAKLEKVRFADDIERKQVLLQLMAGQQISPQTALRTYGIEEPREEIKQTFDWVRMQAEEESEFAEDMKQKEEAGLIEQGMAARSSGMPPGGDPAAAGGGGGAMPVPGMGPGGAPGGQLFSPQEIETPEAMHATAERIAQQIMGMDMSMRRSALIDLNKQNKVLHDLVKGEIDRLENQAATQGKRMARGNIPPVPQ